MKRKHKTHKRINWKSGVGELLSFAIVMPFMVVMICAVLSVTQVSNTHERLSYAAYAACRAAVVSSNEGIARDRAEALLEQMYDDVKAVVFIGPSGDSGTSINLDVGQVYCELSYINEGSNAKWIKGDMIRCTVYEFINPITPFTAGIRHDDIVMMIENNAPEN